jgi:2-oxo-4-hydroxy-4-carboxy-5-ureidoimidazoline decarboxylase
MSDMSRRTIPEINSLSCSEFVREFGAVFEHSPWIAEMTWAKRPFAGVKQMHETLCDTVKMSGLEKQLALLRAHPDLVGRLAQANQLTKESAHEQASAGLDRLTPDEVAQFQRNNAAYHERFGFPFIICARLNKKEAILAGFSRRLSHSREQEVKTALEEVYKIAELRLHDLIAS